MNNKFYGKILAKAVDNHNIPSMIDIKNSEDRKSTRLNSSHANISYAVFCLKKKKIVLLHVHSGADDDFRHVPDILEVAVELDPDAVRRGDVSAGVGIDPPR